MADVREPFASILSSFFRPVEQPTPKPLTQRDRFRVLEEVMYELEAAGCYIDIAQLDWAVKEVNSRLEGIERDRQYDYERARGGAR